ncbi:right-handed parallel beta-helix repeat-containing protein, partial [Candidatus Latescibacterota bacterium]
ILAGAVAAGLWNISCGGDRSPEINVVDYGAVPDDGVNDTAAVQAAIEACREHPGAELVFSAGTYDFSGDTNPRLRLDGFTGLTIDGNGAEFIGHDLATLFRISNCNVLTFRNFTVDWNPLPFSAGKVIEVGDTYFDLEVIEPHTAQARLRVEGILGYDPEKRRLATRGVDIYQTGFEKTTEVIRPGVMRVYVEKRLPEKGTWVNIRHQIYSYNTFTFSKCANIILNDITIYACPGMGLYAHDSSNFTLTRFNVMIRPETGRWMSSTADATHFNNCRGSITLEECLFEGMGDDATNIHGAYMAVDERLGEKTVALKTGRGRRMPSYVRVDDILEFSSPVENPLQPYIENVVISVIPDEQNRRLIVEVADTLPGQTSRGHIVGNISTTPSARILNCTTIRNRARGMLIKTRDVVIEDCVYEDVSGSALLIRADANYWWESIGTRDIMIRNNRFIRCNFGTARREGIINITAQAKEYGLAPAGVHRDITIEHNEVIDADGSALHVGSSDGVVVRNNTFHRVQDSAVSIRDSRNVIITANTLEDGQGGVTYGPNVAKDTVVIENNSGF